MDSDDDSGSETTLGSQTFNIDQDELQPSDVDSMWDSDNELEVDVPPMNTTQLMASFPLTPLEIQRRRAFRTPASISSTIANSDRLEDEDFLNVLNHQRVAGTVGEVSLNTETMREEYQDTRPAMYSSHSDYTFDTPDTMRLHERDADEEEKWDDD